MSIPLRLATTLITLFATVPVALAAQDAPPPPSRVVPLLDRVIGEVAAVEAQDSRLILKTEAGTSVVVAIGRMTALLRAKPGAADLREATPLTLGDIAVGDRVLARGTKEPDGVIAARQVVVMASSDIAARQDSERAEWARRGIAGVVKALDPATGEITIETKSLAGGRSVVLPAGGKTVAFKRYAPGSVKFSDARASSFAEIRVDDQLRARGERTTDGARFVPEQIVTGAFRSVTATIAGVDAAKGLLTVSELGSRAKLTVVVDPGTVLKRLTPETTARLMRRRPDAEPGEAHAGEGQATAPTRGEGRAAAAGATRMRATGNGTTLGDMLDRLPAFTLSDLKAGDIVVFSSASGVDPARLTAITLVAGLEALAPQTPQRGRGRDVTLGLASDALDLGMDLP